MVEESKDGGTQGSEGAHSVKLVVHRLFNHCVTAFRSVQN
jgi:hypothetical protein